MGNAPDNKSLRESGPRSRAPVMSPGVQDLLQDMEKSLAGGTVPLTIFNNPELYEAELEQIFGRCWVFVAHESEIPKPNDYVLRYIGEDAWIVARHSSGQVNVLFNSCMHRGTQVCRADKGNAAYFRCPYHGWTYSNAGELVGMPQRSTVYKTLELDRFGLHKAAKVESYRGLIFANLDPDCAPLAEYLGDMRWYLDLHLGLGGGGMEVVGEPNRWRIAADWKLGGDNFSGDSYHTQSLHSSISEMNLIPKGGVGTGGAFDVHVTEISGHSTSMRRTGPGTDTLFLYPAELKRELTMPDLQPEQQEMARRSMLHTGHVFPNLSFIHIPAVDRPGGEPATYLSLRQWHPKGAGRMEAWSWVLSPKVTADAYRKKAVKVAVASFSPSGNFEQDDMIVWSSISRSARSIPARRGQAYLNYQMGMEGMSEASQMPEWPGPGTAWNTNLEEGVQRTFYGHWLRRMLQR